MSNIYLVKLQPCDRADRMAADGTELTHRPYPFYVTECGHIEHQDFWRGRPAQVMGFTSDLRRPKVELEWAEVYCNPESAVGLYAITADSDGSMGVHIAAIASAEVR